MQRTRRKSDISSAGTVKLRKSDISSAGTVKLRTTKRTPPADAVVRRASMPSMPLDKVDMLVMEANEITQYLQKDYVSCPVFTCFSYRDCVLLLYYIYRACLKQSLSRTVREKNIQISQSHKLNRHTESKVNNNNDFFCANILEDQAQWRDKTKGLSNVVIENNV